MWKIYLVRENFNKMKVTRKVMKCPNHKKSRFTDSQKEQKCLHHGWQHVDTHRGTEFEKIVREKT